jgi:hypothetical protein
MFEVSLHCDLFMCVLHKVYEINVLWVDCVLLSVNTFHPQNYSVEIVNGIWEGKPRLSQEFNFSPV